MRCGPRRSAEGGSGVLSARRAIRFVPVPDEPLKCFEEAVRLCWRLSLDERRRTGHRSSPRARAPRAAVRASDELRVPVTREQVRSAPNIEQHGEELSQADESALYHHYELNYTPDTERTSARSPLRGTVPHSDEMSARARVR